MTLKWDYAAQTVDLSMPGYIDCALKQFQHPHPRHPMHHMLGRNQITVPPPNMPQTWIPHPFWMLLIIPRSKRSLVYYYIISEPWMQLCWLPLAHWPSSRPMGHKPPWNCSPSCQIIVLPILMLSSIILQVHLGRSQHWTGCLALQPATPPMTTDMGQL